MPNSRRTADWAALRTRAAAAAAHKSRARCVKRDWRLGPAAAARPEWEMNKSQENGNMFDFVTLFAFLNAFNITEYCLHMFAEEKSQCRAFLDNYFDTVKMEGN